MSRIGRKPVAIPKGVNIELKGEQISVKGPKGVLQRSLPGEIAVDVQSDKVEITRGVEDKKTRSMHGLVRMLISNMVTGVTDGFAKELEIQGVGYRADLSGKTLKLALGFSHPVEMPVPDGLKVSVDKNTVIRVEGMDPEQVGQFASDIRRLRPPEPYKGKGVRYVDEHVRRKVGKAGAA